MKWVFAAFAVLLLIPLSAEAAFKCRHEQNHGVSHRAHGNQSIPAAESVEDIPVTQAAAPCPAHPGSSLKIKAGMMPKCNMEGCCIKTDGPLSGGLSNRAPTNDDQALSISIEHLQADGRLLDAVPYRLHPQRNLPKPNPRPPAA